VLVLAAKKHFWAFCCYYDWEFFHEKRRFLKQVAIELQSVIDNYRQDISITVGVSMPPRAGKSYITSLFAAYWLSQFPELSVMRNSCTSTLYQKFSYDTRAILKSTKFREVFPEIELAGDKQNLDGWNLKTSKQVGYFGSGVGGTIIGFGANLAITDDLYKSMQDALSVSTDNGVKMWKESAHDSRKEKNCPEIYIGTRWTKNDIIGEAIEKGYLDKYISIPALIDGQSFCEDVKSTTEYLQIRDRIGKMTWNAEYMQDPLNQEGLLLPIESLRFETLTLAPEEVGFRYSVIDPADTGGDKYSVPFIEVVIIGNSIAFYVKDWLHNKDGIEANASRVLERILSHEIEQTFIEVNGVGKAAFTTVKAEYIKVKGKTPDSKLINAFTSTINKDVRVLSNYEFVQKYFIFNKAKYETDSEYKLAISDLTTFTKEGDNQHKKDAIDILCTAASIAKRKFKTVLYK